MHARRRAALSSYFSMQSIRTLEPRITDLVQQMNQRLHDAVAAGTVVHTNHLFSAFAMDVIAEYSLGKIGTTGSLSKPDLGRWWYDLTREQVAVNTFFRHFPLVMRTMMLLPDSLAVKATPAIENFIRWRNSMLSQVKAVLAGDETFKETTVIHELANSSLPPSDKSPLRLAAEANLLLGAGAETTASTIARTVYHILANPEVHKRLQEELTVAMPVADAIPSLSKLSQLPYLNAVIEEGLRVSLPVLSRSPRVFQDHAVQYKEWVIPPGVSLIVSQIQLFRILLSSLSPYTKRLKFHLPTHTPIDTNFTIRILCPHVAHNLPRTRNLQTITLAGQRRLRIRPR